MAEWKATYIHQDANPDKVAAEVMALPDRTTKNIVLMAQDPKTEAHKCFEWDPEKNIQMSLMYQARQMVDHLVISVQIEKQSGEKMMVFLNQFSSVNQRYEATVTEDQELKEEIFKSVAAAFKAAKIKYDVHKALFTAAQVHEIEKLLETI